MARRIYVQRADDVSPLAAMAIVGLFLTVVGPALVVAAGVVAGLAALAAYTVACDLGGWLVVLGATTIAATEPFMSAAPRPYNKPSRTVGSNGGLAQAPCGPGGTTSVWPRKASTGPPVPCVAQRLSTSPKRMCRQVKPAAASLAEIIAWQPSSTGVTDGWRIKSRARSRTAGMAGIVHGAGITAYPLVSAMQAVVFAHAEEDQHPAETHQETESAWDAIPLR